MADSNITKKLLAKALKELMMETSFHKITISDICNRCNMSRKSFYYHFKDKYDLVNWIFDSEYLPTVPDSFSAEQSYFEYRWDLIYHLCNYFYSNKAFYSKVFRIKGQNCFIDYFRELAMPLLEARIKLISQDSKMIAFCKTFYADAFLSALEHWLVEYNDITPIEFVSLLKTCVDELPLQK